MQESYQWYEERSVGLGVRFIAAIDKKLNEITSYPERYPKKKINYREVMLEIFPFAIIYEILKKEKMIFVSYIFHTKRNPAKKYNRQTD